MNVQLQLYVLPQQLLVTIVLLSYFEIYRLIHHSLI